MAKTPRTRPRTSAVPAQPSDSADARPARGRASRVTATDATAAAGTPKSKAARPKAAGRKAAGPKAAPAAPVEAGKGRRPRTGDARPSKRVPGRRLRVLVIGSEMTPFAKTGGLGDVIAGLPAALVRLGHDVTVVVPRHRGVEVEGPAAAAFDVEMGGHTYLARCHVQPLGATGRTVFVDHPPFFDRDGIYGLGSHDYEDNPRRFAFLCLAALEFARRDGQPVDVVHAHDWPGGLAPVYVRTRYQGDPVLGGAATLLTIHNIAFKGLCASDWLPQLGLDWQLFSSEGLEYWLTLSLLKGGIVFSDVITTVSRRHAQELLTPEMALGFEGLMQSRRDDLLGIVNGIDTERWDPARDPHLPEPFDAERLEGKTAATARLLEAYGLSRDAADRRRPVVAMIARMVDQKGLDCIAAVADELLALDATYVVMGEGEPWYEEMWRSLARRYPDRVGVRIGFDEGLSHLIEGGADLLMMPSHYEPCGLNQLYSQRYGTIPVVRATGGLAETVQPYDPETGEGTGFVFEEASGRALLEALQQALRVHRDHPDHWRAMQRAGMARDFSWDASARAYVEAYEQALGKKVSRRSIGAPRLTAHERTS